MDQTTTQRIEEIDWTFPQSERGRSLHSIHPYPAKFIPEIPRTLVRLLPPSEGSRVLDPFCGSGTALVEAQRAGFEAIGVDLNPIACLLSRVKTRPIPPRLLMIGREIATDARERARDLPAPAIPRLDHWFRPRVQAALAGLTAKVGEVADEVTRDALRAALSSIIVRVSNQDSDTRYAAIEKNVGFEDVFSAFERALSEFESHRLLWQHSCPHVEVIEGDAHDVVASQIDKPIGLVITSPPYPNAYEYWLYHKYRMYWLGFDPIAVRDREIGARPHYFKKDPATAQEFFDQMKELLRSIKPLLTPDAHICILVGRSKIRGEIVDNASGIIDGALDSGFELTANTVRTIPRNRKAFNLSHANIKTENLLIFRMA